MQIEVIYCDNSRGKIESCSLSSLIREGSIRSFMRSTGWVHIGSDRIRKYDYVGQERRTILAYHESDLPQIQETFIDAKNEQDLVCQEVLEVCGLELIAGD